MKKRLNLLCVLLLVLMFAQFALVPFYIACEGVPTESFHNSSVRPSLPEAIFVTIGFVAILYLGISSLVYFVRFILNVNHDKVFVLENVKLLRKTGWMLIAVFLIACCMSGLISEDVWDIYTYVNGFLDPIFYLIVAEVFAIGIKLREEQELTI